MKIATKGVSKTLGRIGIALGILLTATLACYTPWQKAQAEAEAVSQFTHLNESIYVPPDAALLAEVHFSGQSHEYASAGAARIYTIPRPCEEVVAEYKEAMGRSGWKATPVSDCDGTVWLNMRTATGAHLGIYADPGENSQLSEEWQTLQEQCDNLYYVSASTYVWYDEEP